MAITNNQHAKAIIEKLTSRQDTTDDEGYYDYFKDRDQMISIVERYLDKNFKNEK